MSKWLFVWEKGGRGNMSKYYMSSLAGVSLSLPPTGDYRNSSNYANLPVFFTAKRDDIPYKKLYE